MKKFSKLVLSLAIALGSSATLAQEITVFAASSMTDVLSQIGKAYQRHHPEDTVVFSFASSSVLAKQIEQDAPADLFVSADTKWMDYVNEKQPQRIKNRVELVENELVLIAPQDSPLAPTEVDKVDYRKVLSDSYLAVGDPNHVPAGRYAKKALMNLNLWQAVENRLAAAKNVRDALSFVERGESPIGIVYATDAKVSQKVKVIGVFPQTSYGKVLYPAATVSDKTEAKRFLDFLGGSEAKAAFLQAGFKSLN